MVRRLPPLNGLRAFEATGRHLSFKNAAEELFVTQAAVSQQVRLLEERTGKKLFQRLPTGLKLTHAGAAAMPLLSHALDLMERATEMLVSDGRVERFTVSLPTSFAARWLINRLNDFQATAPGVQPRIDANDQVVDFSHGGVDLAIRFGLGEYPGLIAELLMPAIFEPVCSPALAEANGGLSTLEDLKKFTLLHRTSRAENTHAPGWDTWLRSVAANDIDTHAGIQVTTSALAIDAAVAGQGVALAARALVWRDIQSGALIAPLSRFRQPADRLGYYLVYPEALELSRPARCFREWIIAQAELERQLMETSDADHPQQA